MRLIHPTERAMEAFSTVKGLADEVYEEALAGLSPDQRETLMLGLATILDNLGGTDGGLPDGGRPKTEGKDT